MAPISHPVSDIQAVLEETRIHFPEANLSIVEKAYQSAKKNHEGQTRKSGEPYINHPLAVAYILAKLEQDPITIAAGLMHDVVEDCKMTIEEAEKKFGSEIAHLVDGVTKLGRITFGSREEYQAESFRKMFLAMAKDIRVVIIKLADRLHNMQTLKYLPPKKQIDVAQETIDIYAPLAHRMGMWGLKWELEDLSFMVLQPQEYQKIREHVSDNRKNREGYVDKIVTEIKKVLDDNAIQAEVTGRPKHFFSIYQKMDQQGLSFDQLYDVLAVRVIVESVRDCYGALGLIHSTWKPIAGRFKDYIAMPKTNMYQSLHTAIIGPQGKPVEVQIRTEQMHKVAEYGIAAHWKYKDGGTHDASYESKLAWIRQLVDWQKDTHDPRAFMDNLRIDLFEDEVFVFTPKGDVRALPLGSTPIDFAYAVHSEVGNRCHGAKVNGAIVPLAHELQNGDIVEVLTQKDAAPNINWLNFAKTSSAKHRIKAWFRKYQVEEHIVAGREELLRAVQTQDLDPEKVMTEKYLNVIFKKLSLQTDKDLYVAIARGDVSARSVANLLKEYHETLFPKPAEWVDQIVDKFRARKRTNDLGVEVGGMEDIECHLAKCCRPLPGDGIVGFITMGHGVAIHRSDCANVVGSGRSDQGQQRIVSARWSAPSKESVYPVEIEIKSFDRVGLLNDILSKISATHTNLREASVRTSKDSSTVLANLILEIKNTNHLQQILTVIRAVDDVLDAYRVLT